MARPVFIALVLVAMLCAAPLASAAVEQPLAGATNRKMLTIAAPPATRNLLARGPVIITQTKPDKPSNPKGTDTTKAVFARLSGSKKP